MCLPLEELDVFNDLFLAVEIESKRANPYSDGFPGNEISGVLR
jgi:hypothetical protein